MKIALAQLNFHIGNFDVNTSKIIDAIQRAKSEHVDLIVFSELAVCGYPSLDFLEFEDFISKCNDALTKLASVCTGIAAIVGVPTKNKNL